MAGYGRSRRGAIGGRETQPRKCARALFVLLCASIRLRSRQSYALCHLMIYSCVSHIVPCESQKGRRVWREYV
jgi:hypothetical protein